MTENLQMALSRVLFEKEPGLLTCDVDASARAAAGVANLLGCILATVLVKQPDTYQQALVASLTKAHESAVATAGKALTINANITVQ